MADEIFVGRGVGQAAPGAVNIAVTFITTVSEENAVVMWYINLWSKLRSSTC